MRPPASQCSKCLRSFRAAPRCGFSSQPRSAEQTRATVEVTRELALPGGCVPRVLRVLEDRSFGGLPSCKGDGTLRTGGVVWDAGLALLARMSELHAAAGAFAGAAVLELGAGCGSYSPPYASSYRTSICPGSSSPSLQSQLSRAAATRCRTPARYSGGDACLARARHTSDARAPRPWSSGVFRRSRAREVAVTSRSQRRRWARAASCAQIGPTILATLRGTLRSMARPPPSRWRLARPFAPWRRPVTPPPPPAPALLSQLGAPQQASAAETHKKGYQCGPA